MRLPPQAIPLCPSFTERKTRSACQHFIRIKINLNTIENRKPNATPDDGEIVEGFSLPLKGLYANLLVLEGERSSIHSIVSSCPKYRDSQGAGLVGEIRHPSHID